MADVRIVTYNVHGLPWNRVPILPILAWITRRTSADIVCLQEVFQRRTLTELIEYAPIYGYRTMVPPECITPSCFANPSGLCSLVKESAISVTDWEFTPFSRAGGLERFVRKGIFRLECWKDGVCFDVFNTHFQSDVTEIPCIRVCHQHTRDHQEDEMDLVVSRSGCPLVVGDFNQSAFRWFDRFDPTFHVTFPETFEHLDHLLLYGPSQTRVSSRKVAWFDEMKASDHVPVLFSLRIRKELNTIPEE